MVKKKVSPFGTVRISKPRPFIIYTHNLYAFDLSFVDGGLFSSKGALLPVSLLGRFVLF